MHMIRALSESFRITLFQTQDGLITLRMGIAHVENYLFIQKMRLQNKLRYSIELEDGIDPDHTMVLHFVLQPLVENAVNHGIAPDGGGEILVMVSLQDSQLLYSVYDTGSAADAQQINRALNTPPTGSHGLALFNINSRIKLKFGREYGVTFIRPEDGGSLFEVRQPLCIRKEEGE